MQVTSKNLYIVSTPIGNLDDITLRAIEILKKSDIILCEDTRRSLKLLNHFKIKKKLISYHKFNEKKQIERILKHINEGKILSLISDAGTPLLSDPGKILINECIKRDIKLIPIPGVSSITTAMSISGFNDQFLFYGFLPKKENEINKILLNLSSYEFTQIFFIPAVKLNFYLEIFKRVNTKPEFNKSFSFILSNEPGDIKILAKNEKNHLWLLNYLNKISYSKYQNLNFLNYNDFGKNDRLWILCHLPSNGFKCNSDKINKDYIITLDKSFSLIKVFLFEKK